jgi:hypothetical protein
VIVYTLAADGGLGLAAGNNTSTGALLPTGTLNDFLFDISGKYLGALGTDSVGNPVLIPSSATSLAPGGWSSGGGGSVSAPELDATSAVSALMLTIGGLMVALAGRRSRGLGPVN